jgi:hypothetical protein
MMDIVRLLAIVASITIFIFIIELIRRGRLKEKYALLWLFSSLLMLGLSLSRDILEGLSRLAGIYYAPSLLFLAAFIFLLLINLHYSVVLSELSEKNKRLTQEIALLRFELENERKNGG